MSSSLPQPSSPGTGSAPVPGLGSLGQSNAVTVPQGIPTADVPTPGINRRTAVQGSTAADESSDKHRMIHLKLGLISSLFYALHAKHVPTASHSLRVAVTVSAWGLGERLRDKELELVEVAGLLHDLGKIGVPDTILQKPTRLTADEQTLMALHPKIGIEILRSAGASDPLLHAVDRVGIWFNDPLISEKVSFESLAAQMISIADAYDAMVTDQIYRSALSQEEAIKELFNHSGTQFNPKLVRSFANCMTNKSPDQELELQKRWLGGFRTNNKLVPSQFTSVSTLNLNAAQQSLTSVFRNQLIDTMQDGVFFVDLDGQILEWNSTAERLTGRTRHSLLQHQWTCHLLNLKDPHGYEVASLDCPIRQVMKSRAQVTCRYGYQHADGREMLVEFDVIPVFDQNRNMCGVATFFRDASEQVNLEQHVANLHERATKDPLTKVANRAELNRRLPEFVTHHLETNEPGSLIICDIDFFKKVNDTYGHPVGDEALVMFAALLRELTRDTDLVARYGGEEFVILCPSCDIKRAVEKAERIRSELAHRPMRSLRGTCISASFGVSQILKEDDGERLLNRADQALLMAKENGRNRVQQLITLSEPNASPVNTTSSNWFNWFGGAPGEVLLDSELHADVPHELTLRRLQGLITDKQMEVVSTVGDRATLKVDSKNCLPPQRESDRPLSFTVELTLSEAMLDMNGQTRQCSYLRLIIRSARNRDRRSANLVHQAERIRAMFQSYLMANQLDLRTREAMTIAGQPLS